ncbi:PUA-like domain-containing protein [Xylariaceae sp. FL1651]|nr:PUA-like domain-containing protein [Xylariaceae sp. FL1651]
MPKRKAIQLGAEDEANSTNLRRSTRRKSSVLDAAAKKNKSDSATSTPAPEPTEISRASKSKTKSPRSKSEKAKACHLSNFLTITKPAKTPNASGGGTSDSLENERWYWLMKAEPESRFENGVDVKFSIDDLASRKEPEPWDGIRAYAARNNLRSMKKGELAFFYQSNCKEPGIVGTMEIVQEHSPDLSAHDPKAPYYDPSSKPQDPKWSVVHVKFRSKFAQAIGLKELREMGKPGQPLENMQMLKQSRLSVSRVSPSEWDHLMGVVQRQGGEALKIS